jgi:phage protein D
MSQTMPTLMKSPQVRQPRAAVILNGVKLKGGVPGVDVVNNNYFQADSFSVSLALSSLPSEFNAAYFGKTDQIELEVLAGFGTELQSLVLGRVDDVDLDLEHKQVRLSGRDLTSVLIDTRTTEKYANRTASEIVTILGEAAGLTVKAPATTGLAGTYYRTDHVELAHDTTAWNLLTYLAEKAERDLFVRGRTLYFVPPSEQRAAPLIWDATGSIPSANVSGLKLRRNLTLSRDVTVRVISWHSGQGRTISATRRAQRGQRSQQTGGQGQVYIVRIPNLTQEEAIRRAEQILETRTQHERIIEVEMPGEFSLMPGITVPLKGTGTSWDQDYFVDEVKRSLSFESGFTQQLRLKNHSPQTMVSV